MSQIQRIVLDVLKPHQPTVIEFAMALAEVGSDYKVHLMVIELDENTATLQIEITAQSIDFDAIQEKIVGMGGSLHSIDEVDVYNTRNQE